MVNERFAHLVAPFGGSFPARESEDCARAPRARDPPTSHLLPFTAPPDASISSFIFLRPHLFR
jgi:hypothetical protein